MIRRHPILTTIFLTIFSLSAYSHVTDTLKAKQIIISTSMLGYLPTITLNTVNFNIGTEIYLKNRKSLYANYGLIKSYGQSNTNLKQLKILVTILRYIHFINGQRQTDKKPLLTILTTIHSQTLLITSKISTR
ncbi:MAG: hypothetical protein HY738_12070 [Bacteroidia bacterium]|nr:hypothetical protein [Bacteroidia bacterium]